MGACKKGCIEIVFPFVCKNDFFIRIIGLRFVQKKVEACDWACGYVFELHLKNCS